MRYETAVGHLRIAVDACQRAADSAGRMRERPLVVALYVFGDLLAGPREPERSQLAFVLDLPVERVTWYSEPREGFYFADQMRINRYPFEYYWRPAAWPVWNHYIRDPVELWSIAGPSGALEALAERRFDALIRALPSSAEEARQREVELAVSEEHLRDMLDRYWDQGWRRAHKFNGNHPEDHLWRATYGFLELVSWQPGRG